jgi:hypothetical protein
VYRKQAYNSMLHRPSHVNHGALAARRLIPPLSATLTSSVLVAADTIAILGAGYLSYVLLTERAGPLAEACVLFVWLVSMMLMHFAGLYRFQAASQPLRYVVPVAVALATAFLFLLAAGFSIKVSDTFSRLWITSFAGGSLTFVLLGRAAVSASFSGSSATSCCAATWRSSGTASRRFASCSGSTRTACIRSRSAACSSMVPSTWLRG